MFQLFKLWRIWKYGEPIYPDAPATRRIVKNFTSKSELKRNLLAAIIIKGRKAYPYDDSENYSDAKKLYEDYFKMENHIPSLSHINDKIVAGETVYVTKFRTDVPVKGERYCEYHINYHGLGDNTKHKTFICTDVCMSIKNEPLYISLIGVNKTYHSIDGGGEHTDFRYATQEEIDNFKLVQEKIKNLNRELDKLQKQKEKLYAEIGNLC